MSLLGKAKDLANDLNEKVVAVLIGHNVKKTLQLSLVLTVQIKLSL